MTLQVSVEALHAIHRVLITVRAMGYEGVDSAKVAAIMDDAEYLPTILIDGEACCNEFGDYLCGMAKKWNEFTGIAEEYANAEKNPSAWLEIEFAKASSRFASAREDFNFNTEVAKGKVATAA